MSLSHAPKAPLLHVLLERVEGPLATASCMSFEEANQVLREWSWSAPAGGGYDKVRVELLWANGQQYVYRVDLQHPQEAQTLDIAGDVRHAIDFLLGRKDNPDWDAAQHCRVRGRYQRDGTLDLLRAIDRTCAVG